MCKFQLECTTARALGTETAQCQRYLISATQYCARVKRFSTQWPVVFFALCLYATLIGKKTEKNIVAN